MTTNLASPRPRNISPLAPLYIVFCFVRLKVRNTYHSTQKALTLAVFYFCSLIHCTYLFFSPSYYVVTFAMLVLSQFSLRNGLKGYDTEVIFCLFVCGIWDLGSICFLVGYIVNIWTGLDCAILASFSGLRMVKLLGEGYKAMRLGGFFGCEMLKCLDHLSSIFYPAIFRARFRVLL